MKSENPHQHTHPDEHEEWENDYYARRSSGGILAALFILGLVAMGCITFIGKFILSLI